MYDAAAAVSRISVAVSDAIIGEVINVPLETLEEQQARQAEERSRARRKGYAQISTACMTCLVWVLTVLLWAMSWDGQDSEWHCVPPRGSIEDGSLSGDTGEAEVPWHPSL